MSKLISVCAVRDSAMHAYAAPMFVPSPGVAVRSFTSEVNRVDPQNMLNQHPTDFELWWIAEFDEETGHFSVPEGGPRCVSRAKDVKAE